MLYVVHRSHCLVYSVQKRLKSILAFVCPLVCASYSFRVVRFVFPLLVPLTYILFVR